MTTMWSRSRHAAGGIVVVKLFPIGSTLFWNIYMISRALELEFLQLIVKIQIDTQKVSEISVNY